MSRQQLGRWGEAEAAQYLEVRGCRIQATNWRCAAGEADLIILDGECLALVEVRTRRSGAFGSAEESITPHKLARMVAVAETYVYEQGWAGDWRLDVVAIQKSGSGPPHIEWYRSVSG